jgi:hypothetical protein
MALFSRRPKPAPDDATPKADRAEAEQPAAEPSGAEQAEAPEAVPEVAISMSSFDALGRSAARPSPSPSPASSPVRGPAEAPPPETVAGLAENVLLRNAVTAFAAAPGPAPLIEVARQAMQGQVYLRVKGDARAMLTQGADLPFAVARRGDQQFAVIFSGGRALQTAVQTDGASDTSAIGQPATAVLRQVLAGTYAGVVIDSWAGRTSPVLPRALLQTALDEADPQGRIKTLLAAPRTTQTVADVVTALAERRVWVAAGKAQGSDAWGIAESRSTDGVRLLSVFSHPLEVAALGRGDRPVPITASQLARALSSDAGLSGVLVDPAGPWLRVDRGDLGPLLARFDAS